MIVRKLLINRYITAVKPGKLLPAGSAYLAHARRAIHNLSHEESHAIEAAERHRRSGGDKVEAEDDLGVGEEEESDELLALDPKEWKVGIPAYADRVMLIYDSCSNKIIMPYLDYRISDIRLHPLK